MRALVAALAFPLALLGTGPGQAATVAGAAYGASLDTALGPTLPKTPSVELDPNAGPTMAEAPRIELASLLRTGPLSAQTSGGFGEATTSSRSQTTVHAVDVLDGLITADIVRAASSSVADGRRATSRSDGSSIVGLKVDGRALPGLLTPNWRIELPDVGYAVLNEQLRSGDGVGESGLTVNMIHVIMLDRAGKRTGEVIVGSAHSGAGFLPSDRVP